MISQIRYLAEKSGMLTSNAFIIFQISPFRPLILHIVVKIAAFVDVFFQGSGSRIIGIRVTLCKTM